MSNPVPSVQRAVLKWQRIQKYQENCKVPCKKTLKEDLQILLDVFGLELVASMLGEITGEELNAG